VIVLSITLLARELATDMRNAGARLNHLTTVVPTTTLPTAIVARREPDAPSVDATGGF